MNANQKNYNSLTRNVGVYFNKTTNRLCNYGYFCFYGFVILFLDNRRPDTLEYVVKAKISNVLKLEAKQLNTKTEQKKNPK